MGVYNITAFLLLKRTGIELGDSFDIVHIHTYVHVIVKGTCKVDFESIS